MGKGIRGAVVLKRLTVIRTSRDRVAVTQSGGNGDVIIVVSPPANHIAWAGRLGLRRRERLPRQQGEQEREP